MLSYRRIQLPNCSSWHKKQMLLKSFREILQHFWFTSYVCVCVCICIECLCNCMCKNLETCKKNHVVNAAVHYKICIYEYIYKIYIHIHAHTYICSMYIKKTTICTQVKHTNKIFIFSNTYKLSHTLKHGYYLASFNIKTTLKKNIAIFI